MAILVIEDNKEILTNILDYLGMQGYTVDCAQDGLTALHLISTQPYDLLILDVMLPGVDGYQICRRLRQDMQLGTPVIMLTARDSLDDRLQGFRAGVDDYVVKPFALSELAARVEAMLRRAQGGGLRRLLDAAPDLARNYPDDEVGQLAASFDDLLERFRQALRREKLFSADVSHELRTPLMVIASTCELLLVDANLPAATRRKIHGIAAAAEEMRQLVHTLLMLLRSEQNKYDKLPEASLKDIFYGIEKEWRPLIEAQGLRFEVNVPAYDGSRRVLPEVFIRIILNNLLHNALHHTGKGAISLTMVNGGLVVRDTGVGIPAIEQQQIFEPFIQGQARQGTDGIGLGLSLVRRICHSQGWTLRLDSSEGGGSRFTLKFADP